MEKCTSVFILYHLYCWKWHFTRYSFLLALLFHAAQFYFLKDHWKIQSVHFRCWVSSITLIKGFSVKVSFGSTFQAQVSSRTLLASNLIQTSDILTSTSGNHFGYPTHFPRAAETLRLQSIPQYIDIATLWLDAFKYLIQHKDVTRQHSSSFFFSPPLELTVLSVTLNIALVATWSPGAVWPYLFGQNTFFMPHTLLSLIMWKALAECGIFYFAAPL